LLDSFHREELQDFLDERAVVLSFSVVDHLRWDLKRVFDMAVNEGLIDRNPALLLFTPKTAKKPTRRCMTIAEVRDLLDILNPRERLIAKLAILAGMRPGEIFALTWGRVAENCADVTQRVYRGLIDTPRSNLSVRQAALTNGLLADLHVWRCLAVSTLPNAWVFASERGTPLRKDNIWWRSMKPQLQAIGLACATSRSCDERTRRSCAI
jgi:integrase